LKPAMVNWHPFSPFAWGPMIFLGVGLGGFFDGIVLHQLLQWHHMVSSWYPPTSLANLRLNTLWDGIFHSATYVVVVVALFRLWRRSGNEDLYWSPQLVCSALLLGWGAFNLAEGLIDHQLLGIHHVNERVAVNQRPFWDIAFLVWGGAMLGGGFLLARLGIRGRDTLLLHRGR